MAGSLPELPDQGAGRAPQPVVITGLIPKRDLVDAPAALLAAIDYIGLSHLKSENRNCQQYFFHDMIVCDEKTEIKRNISRNIGRKTALDGIGSLINPYRIGI
jgi:hypothetical protein